MKFNLFKSRASRFGAYFALYLVIVIAVLATVNWLGQRHNKSWDLTSAKQYSLSDQTKKIVGNLKQDVIISYFDRSTGFGQAKDLLDRYDTLSPKLTIEYIDPFKKPQLAKQYGIRTAGTALVRVGDRTQEARGMTEEDLTSALIRALKTGEKTACFVAGAGEASVDDSAEPGYAGVKELLEKNNYKVQTANLLEKPEIPKDCRILVVAGPRVDYPQPVVDAMKKFVEEGNSALFMTQPPLDDGKNKISDNKAFHDMLAAWGVTANRDQVLDASGLGGLYGLGPEVALASKYESHSIVRDMKGTAAAFALARSLEVKAGDKTSVEKLVSTTPNSISTTQLAGVSRRIDPAKSKTDSFTVAAAGTFRTGKENNEGRFVVVGSADWAANYILRFAGNRDLFLNMINWLSADEDLISIRPKDPEDRRIQLTRAQMTLVRTVSQFLIPLAVIALGVMVWWRRR
jgi:ABC-type uncharacterized transport system involved in gliding motility auxiliary subunit